MEQRNAYQIVRDFVQARTDAIKENWAIFRGQPTADRNTLVKCCSMMILNILVIVSMVGVVVWMLAQIAPVLSSVMRFLNNPSHAVIKNVAVATGVMALIAVIANTFKKPQGIKSERQEDAEKKTLAKDLFRAVQKLASMYGLEKPDGLGDLSSFAISPSEEINGATVYTFSMEKDTSSDKPFSEQRFKKSLIRRLKKMERDNELTVSAPYGYEGSDEELSAIIILSVEDKGDYILLRVARADEASYALYKSESQNQSAAPNDADF
jgi:K+-sensing histidine kinase KdpD